MNSIFCIDPEYSFVKELGKGTFGRVIAARHRKTGEGRAIKQITNVNAKVCLPGVA